MMDVVNMVDVSGWIINSDLIASMTCCAECFCCCLTSVLVVASLTWHAINSCQTYSAHTVC